MEGDGFENGIMGAFESSVDDSETTAERRGGVSESLAEGMGEAALRVEKLTDDSKERKAAEAVDVIRGLIKKAVERAEKGIESSDEEEAAAEADLEGALKSAEDSGCLKEVCDMLFDDDVFFGTGLFYEFEKRGVLSIYDIAKKCSSERLNDSSLGNLRYRIGREVETMSDQKEDLTDEQLEFLGTLSQKGINPLKASLSMNLYSINGDVEQENQKGWQDEQKRAAEHFYEQLRDRGLVKKDDVMEVYSGLFGHYSGEAKSFIKASTFLEDFVRDNPDDLPIENDYWLKTISEKGIDNLLDFRSSVSRGDVSVLDRYSFEQKVVKKAFFELFKSRPTYSFGENAFNKAIEKRVEDAETLEVILQVLDENAPKEGSFSRDSKLIRFVVRNREVLDDLVKSGKFEKYPKLKQYEVLDEASGDGLTEKRRLQYLFGNIRVGDSQFDENGEPLDSFYESVLNRRDEEIFGALDKRGKLLAIRGCRKSGGSLDKFRGVETELLKESGAFSEAELAFLEMSNDIGNKMNEFRFVTFDKIDNYFSSNGPTDEFFVECFKSGKIGILGEFSDEQKERYGFSESTKALSLGVSFKNILGGEDAEVNESNVLAALARFIKMDANHWSGASEDDLRVKGAFSETNIKNKNLAMQMLRKEYEQYPKTGVMPVGLRLFAEYMHKCDGAGPLTQIEMFLDYCGELGKANDDEVAKGASSIEKKIRKWDDQEKANFYSISAEIMKADPEIYKEFLSVFDRIKEEEDFKVFVKEIFPLYRAKLALLKEYDYKGDNIGHGVSTASYKNLDKAKLMNDLHLALLPFSFESRGDGEGDKAYRERRRAGIEKVKSNIFGEISGLFQEKFGILPEAIPEELDRDAMRAIEDMVLYLSNINDPNENKKNLIGFFLALQLKKGERGRTAWDDLRAGREIDPSMFLGPEIAGSVAKALERSRKSDPITSENVGIANSERLSAFREMLQRETSEIRVGSVLTVDTKLQTVSQNIIELMDPDLYDDPMDKAKIELLKDYEPEMMTGVATKLWERESGKNVTFSAEEAEVAQILETMLAGNGIEFTPENINKHLQRGFKVLGKIAAAYKMIEGSNISEIVSDLQGMLMPRGEVAEIFAELGEEFQPHSGILALSADIEFLESIVMKAEKADMLSGDEEEKKRKIEVVKEYLNEVREKFAQIDALYNEVVKKFENISKNSKKKDKKKDKEQDKEQESSNRGKLVTKLQEIDAMIGKREGGAQSTITTVCSNKMPVIIENIRACLSCKTRGCNNDTNLTFGEGYPFYLYSRGSAREAGSVSDEIVYLVPVGEEGDRRMAFVMDQVYGNKSRDIYLNHAATVIKKAKGLKKKFPEARISIFLTSASASSCGTLLNKDLIERLGVPQDAVVIERSALKVNIPESGFGDHYIEIDDDARTSGGRNVGGIEIIL